MTDDDIESRLAEQNETITEQQERIDQLEETVRKMLPSRRGALKILGGAGAGALAGQAISGSAAAGNNEVGTIGTTSERVDLNAEDIDAKAVSTDEGRFNNYLNSQVTRPNGRLSHMPPSAASHSRTAGVVAIETDDAKSETYTETYPEMQSRGLPWSIAVPYRNIGDPDTVTWAELQEMYAEGAEIAVHPGSTDISSDSKSDVVDQILNGKQTFEDKNIGVQRLVTSAVPDFDDDKQIENTFGGHLVLGNFNSLGQVWHNLPGNKTRRVGPIGGAYQTQRMRIDEMSETKALNVIDLIAESGASVVLYFHPHTIGDTGHLTLTELQNILDKIASLRNSGSLNVVTPTQAQYQYGDSRDAHMNPSPGFESSATLISDTPSDPMQWIEGSSGDATITTTDAHNGSQSLELAAGGNIDYKPGMGGQPNHYVVEGYAKRAASGDDSLRVGMNTSIDLWPDLNGYIPGRQFFTVNNTWNHFVSVIGLPKESSGGKVTLANFSSGTAMYIDDVYVYPV